MAHARKQIRDATLVTLTGLNTTGFNVHFSRGRPWQSSELPGLAISIVREEVDENIGDLHLRSLLISVQAIEQSSSADIDDLLDNICLEVENAMLSSVHLAAIITDIALESTTMEIAGESDKPVAVCNMVWTLLYQVNPADPETIITTN